MLLLILAGTRALAAEVTAELDRKQVIEGETVTLTLQTNDSQQSLEADLSALEGDFQIIDRRSETQMSIVNGRQSAVVRLLLTLEPTRSGRLRIPSLELPGGATTRPLTVDVQPAPKPGPGEQEPVFIEVELEPRQGPYYVHAQLSLKVRIFYQQNLTEAAINPPAPQQASVRLLDEVPYQAERDGLRYRVLERRYAIFPERSGELTIPPMQLTGRLINRPSDRLWQPSSRGRRVRIDSEPMSLVISPKPPGYSGEHWLPARRVDLSQQISDADALRVGEPVTRTVILDAVGLEEHMLEEPVWPEVPNARIYPDQPQGISRDNGEWLLGHREFRYAVVPEQAGEFTLPEIRLQWWDTVADRERVAVLPSHTMEVLPSQLAALSPGQALSQPAGRGLMGGADQQQLMLWRLLAAVFALLWLSSLWFVFRARPAKTAKKRTGHEDSEAELLKEIRRECRRGNARQARNALARWLRRHGPTEAGGNLMALASSQASPELARAIRELDAGRFGSAGEGPWEGEGLWQAFESWREARHRPAAAAASESFDLYAVAR